jgi:hypothetical protein
MRSEPAALGGSLPHDAEIARDPVSLDVVGGDDQHRLFPECDPHQLERVKLWRLSAHDLFRTAFHVSGSTAT